MFLLFKYVKLVPSPGRKTPQITINSLKDTAFNNRMIIQSNLKDTKLTYSRPAI